MNKASCRAAYLQRRQELSESARSRMDDLILIRFQQWQTPEPLNTVLSYWPLQERAEPNTFLLTDFLAFRLPELQLAYPVINAAIADMEAVGVHDDTAYRKNQYGIAEPVEGQILAPASIDLVLVPLLAFDKKGNRLGYGKGFYDRFITKLRPDCYKLGISYFEPMEELPELGGHDLPLNGCITPDSFYEF